MAPTQKKEILLKPYTKRYAGKTSAHSGAALFLLMFVVLTLLSFGALSFTTARADLAQSVRYSEKTLAYYAAQNAAQEFLAEENTRLQGIYQSSKDSTEYFDRAGKEIVKTFPCGEHQALQLTVTPLYPSVLYSDSSYLQVVSEKVIATTEFDYNTNLNLF